MVHFSYSAVASYFCVDSLNKGKRCEIKPYGNSIAHFGGMHVERKGASEYEGQQLQCFDVRTDLLLVLTSTDTCACVGVVRVRYIAPHISLNTTCSPTQQMTTIGTTTQHNPLITQKQTNQTTTNATNQNNALYRNT